MISSPLSLIDLGLLVIAFDLIGSLVIVGYVLAALLALVRRRGIARARLLVADGALWGLSVKVAATLLKTITLHTAQSVALFVIVFALRTMLKRIFTWERGMIERTLPQQRTPA